MDNLVRIGPRLFNLAHISSIEPAEDAGRPVADAVDVHIVAGRVVRLRGDDARAAAFFVESIPPLPVDRADRERVEREEQAAQDMALVRLEEAREVADPRRQ